MATRQYIGARYVPRFLGTYDATTIYEALDVVDNGSGTSYIAKKTVPAGTSLLDTDYWFVYGASSGAIINLQSQIDAAVLDIGTNSGNITTLTGKVNGIEEELDSNRKFLFIGDSYCDANRGGFAHGVATVVQDYLGKSSDDFIIYQKGGAGFVANGQGKTFEDLLDDAIANEDLSEITDVVIQTAGNDADTAYGTINLAISSFITKFNNNFSSDVSLYIAPCRGEKGCTSKNNYYNNFWYILTYANAVKRYKIITNAGSGMVLFTSFTSGDNVHPNTQGCVLIGRVIGSALASRASVGEYGHFRENASITLDSALTSITNGAFVYRGNGENGVISWAGLAASGSFTLTAGGISLKLGTLAMLVSNAASPSVQPVVAVPVSATFLSSGSLITVPGQLKLVYDSVNDRCDVYFFAARAVAASATEVTIQPVMFTISNGMF